MGGPYTIDIMISCPTAPLTKHLKYYKSCMNDMGIKIK